MYVFEREEIFICLVLQCMVLRDIAKYCIHVLVRAHMHVTVLFYPMKHTV